MKKVIMSGATGFIGSHLIERLLRKNINVTALVRKNSKNTFKLLNYKEINIVYIDKNDVLELPTILNDSSYDVFYDLSWEGVSGNERGDYKLQLKNVENTLNCVVVAKKLGCKTFIGSSSVREYECAKYMPIDNVKVGRRFIYSTSKMTMHYMAKCLASDLDINYINANIANVYGENGSDNLLLHDTIIKLLKNIPTSFTDATQNHDFLYVKDVAEGLYNIGESGKPFYSYYVGSDSPKTLKEYLTITKNIINPSINLGFGKLKSDGMNMDKEVFDNTKLKEHTNFKQFLVLKKELQIQ